MRGEQGTLDQELSIEVFSLRGSLDIEAETLSCSCRHALELRENVQEKAIH